MCTKRKLYSAGDKGLVNLRTREQGGKLNFSQISYTTDCVREVANSLDIPMVKAIGELRERGAFAVIYKEAKRKVQRPVREVAREVLAM